MTATITAPADQAIDVTTMTDDQLAAAVTVHGHNDDMVTALITELERRDAQDHEVDETTRLRDLVAQERRTGETIDQTVDRMYGNVTFERYLAAENATRGHMLNPVGLAAAVDPYSLFHGPARRAAKYASRELLDWWQVNGRVTWIEFKAERLGRPSDIRAAAAARRRAHDFGL